MRLRPSRFSPSRRASATNGARFAYFPKRLSNGTWVWLEKYHRYNRYRDYAENYDSRKDPIPHKTITGPTMS